MRKILCPVLFLSAALVGGLLGATPSHASPSLFGGIFVSCQQQCRNDYAACTAKCVRSSIPCLDACYVAATACTNACNP